MSDRIVCRIEIIGVKRDGGRGIGLSANRTADILASVSKAWPGVWFRGSWPGTVEFGVTDASADGLGSQESQP
jgi:hypothetical protein